MKVALASSAGPRFVPPPGDAPLAAAPGATWLPGPVLPGIPPHHPALPSPPPSLEALERIAASAPAAGRFTPGSEPAAVRNAHYSNTRSQLAYALGHDYNSVEGDVRLRDGVAVMKHDPSAPYDLTFEQWATLANRAGRHLRVDLKEAAALPSVTATLERLHVPPGSITFNVAADAPWSSAAMSTSAIRALRTRFAGCWITLNLPLPLGPGFLLAARAADAIGRDHLGVAITAKLAHGRDVAFLRRHFAVVNAWNVPQLGNLDVPAETARLRAMGVNGMVDLRRRDDPLANH